MNRAKRHHHNQNGITLITVLVMLLLSTLLIIGSTRLTLVSEKLAGNDTDYQRAYQAAEALIADAKLDLDCLNVSATAGCGFRATPVIPCDAATYATLEDALTPLNPPCQNGICLDLGDRTSGNPNRSFWNSTALWTAYTAAGVGAIYGQYTNSSIAAGQAVNPILVGTNARYWIEVLKYTSSATSQAVYLGDGITNIAPHTSCPYVFRITAVARGIKTGTSAVVQSYYTFPDPQSN
ncbi:MAG: pilus assembly PilX family protein [Rhodoferax sp.]